MSRAGRWKWGIIGAALGMVTSGVGSAAAGEDPIRAGTWELTVAGGYSVSHNVTLAEDLVSLTAYHALPHVGYVLTEQHGSGWLRGNLELLLEPTGLQIQGKRHTANVGGLSGLGRWMRATPSAFRPYLELGGGVIVGETRLRQTTCDVNFILEGGPGLLIFLSDRTALTVGYRYHHVSNGSKCTPNLGLNSSLFILGLTHFFR